MEQLPKEDPMETSEMSRSIQDGQITATVAMLSVLSVIGSIGNILVVYLYANKNDKLTSTLFILVLATADSFTCTFMIPYTAVVEHLRWHVSSTFLCKTYYLLNSTMILFSALLISAIAIDRYFCICYPFLHLMTIYRAKLVISFLACFALTDGILISTQLIVHEINSLNSSELNNVSKHVPVYECVEISKITPLKELSLFNRVLFHVSQKGQTVSFFLCSIIVIVLYVCIYRTILKVRKKRQEMKGLRQAKTSKPLNSRTGSKESLKQTTITPNQCETEINGNESSVSLNVSSPDHKRNVTVKQKDTTNFQNFKTAMMLFVVAVVYIICFLPAILMATELITINLPVFYMYYCNSTANPIIYCFMNKNLRDDIIRIFCRRQQSINESNSRSHTSKK